TGPGILIGPATRDTGAVVVSRPLPARGQGDRFRWAGRRRPAGVRRHRVGTSPATSLPSDGVPAAVTARRGRTAGGRPPVVGLRRGQRPAVPGEPPVSGRVVAVTRSEGDPGPWVGPSGAADHCSLATRMAVAAPAAR